MPRIYCHIQRNPTENGQTERDAGPRVYHSNSYIAIASCLTIDNDVSMVRMTVKMMFPAVRHMLSQAR